MDLFGQQTQLFIRLNNNEKEFYEFGADHLIKIFVPVTVIGEQIQMQILNFSDIKIINNVVADTFFLFKWFFLCLNIVFVFFS